jgi:hypothetical protein
LWLRIRRRFLKCDVKSISNQKNSKLDFIKIKTFVNQLLGKGQSRRITVGGQSGQKSCWNPISTKIVRHGTVHLSTQPPGKLKVGGGSWSKPVWEKMWGSISKISRIKSTGGHDSNVSMPAYQVRGPEFKTPGPQKNNLFLYQKTQ